MTRIRLMPALVLLLVLGFVLGPSIVGPSAPPPPPAPAAVLAIEQAQPRSAENTLAVAEPVFVGQGCGWWTSSGSTTTEQSASQIAMCVFEQLLQGVTNPVTIGAACGNITLSQVLAVLDSVLNFYTQPQATDAGAAVAMLCGTGVPPVQGANACISSEVVTRVSVVRAATAAKIAGKG